VEEGSEVEGGGKVYLRVGWIFEGLVIVIVDATIL
jgi:hypothetical protein